MYGLMWSGVSLFAQADGGQGGGSLMQLLLTVVVPIGVLFYFMVIMPEKRRNAARQAMLTGIKKNDRVVVAGGIYGVVSNTQPETDELTVRIDEATNTKIRVSFSSVIRVMSDSADEKDNGKK